MVAVDGCLMLDVAIPLQVFGQHGDAWYRFTIAGCRTGPVHTSTGVVIDAEAGLEALAAADTIIVPGYDDVQTPPPEPLLSALRTAASSGTRLVSMCTGAFVLAWAGLLDGRTATTHWLSAGLLAARFPAVSVDPGALYIDDGDVLTSAGFAAGLDLCLHIVRRDHGASVAAAIARVAVAAPHRDGGQSQLIERPIAAAYGEPSLSSTRAWALERLHEPIDLARLASHACVSPRTFSRRFRAETGTTPAQWLLGQRVALALQLLEDADLPVSSVARVAGFASPAALRRHLTRSTGTTPGAYRRATALAEPAPARPHSADSEGGPGHRPGPPPVAKSLWSAS